MNVALSLLVAILFGCGVRFLIRRNLFHVVVGTILLSNSAILLLISSGHGGRAIPLITSEEAISAADFADPLVQAFALTAVVIGFATTVLLVRVTLSLQESQRDLDIVALQEAEVEREGDLE